MTNNGVTTTMNKEQARAELHRAIWQIANDLRGSVDGWDFKSYVLGMFFIALLVKISPSISIAINFPRPYGRGFK